MYLCILLLATASFIPSSSITVYVNDSSPLASNSTSCGPVTEPCQALDLGLDVIQYSLKRHNVSDASVELIIAEGEYDHTNTSNGVFRDVNSIRITGETGFKITVNCAGDSGFSFIYSSHIVINGIEFIGCGQLQNSTSYTSSTSFSPFYVGLYFLYCRDVNLTGVSVSNSQATGIVLYNIIGTNILDTVTVSNNIFTTDREMEGSGGGVYIEYSYCVPSGHESDIIGCLSKGISNVNVDYTNNSSFFITNSYFINNRANISNTITSTFILPIKQDHAPFGRGGGLSIFFKGNASNNSITVTDCIFDSNKALWGGGLFVEFQDSAFKNTFTIISSHLLNNSLYFNDRLNEGTGGGGARVGYVFFDKALSYSNEIVFHDCVFDSNSAYYGGGLSFYSARQSLVDDDHLLNVLKLTDCNFTGNIGRIGAGLDLSLWHPSITGKHPYCLIVDTVFINNYPVNPSNGGLVGIGAVYIDSLPTTFTGQVSFEGNNGTALVATGTHVNISNGTNVTFIRNTGRNGAAIALLDTFIVTSEGSSLYFLNNWALYKGGAIYSFHAGERDLLSSRNCFLRYEDISIDPEEWDVYFFFQNNTIQLHPGSGRLNAIYATSLLPCIWGGSYGNSTYKNFSESRVFCWNKSKWTYKDGKGNYTSCNHQIRSSPMTFSNTTPSYSRKPGQSIQLGFTVHDELNNNVINTSIFIAKIISGSGTFRNNSLFTYVSHEHLEVYGMPYSNVDVQLETLDPVVTRNTMNVTIEPCAPGFTFDNNAMGCYCYNTSAFNGYIQCNQNSFQSTILHTAWVGKRPGEQFLVVGETPYSDRNTITQSTTLYNDSEEYLNKIFCGYSYRNGTLCGSCQNGYGVEVTSYQYDCINCTGSQGINWVYYVIFTYLPITAFFIIVFLFSVTVTSGPLNAFVFFAQVIATTIAVDADGMIPLQNVASTKLYPVLTGFYVFLYSIWNMEFYTGFIKKFCLSPSFNTMDVFLLRYGEALYPLVLLFIIVGAINLYNKGFRCVVLFLRPFHYCLARFRQWSNLRQSVTGGIAVFIVISYTKFTLVSLLILTSINLYDSTGHTVAKVHYYDGNIDFPRGIYIIPALIILITFGFIPPLLLIYPSVLRLIERLSCWRLKMTKLYPFPKMSMFMDEFYGCYKDGRDRTLDCRWFAGFYFVLRIILFAVYSFTAEWHTQYLVQTLLFLLVAFLFAFIRPYRDDWVNNIDCGFFLLLSAISVISLFNLMKTRIGESLGHWAFAIQYILILIPLLYCVGYYLVFVYKRSKDAFKKYTAAKLRQSQESEDQGNDEDSHGYRNALVDNNHVPSIMEYIEPRSRMRLSNSASWRAGSDQTAPLLPERSQNEINREAIIAESAINK